MPWTLTVQNNPDGTYHYLAKAEDGGSCAYANNLWHLASSLTGLSSGGTYRIVDSQHVEFTGPTGPAVWARK
jgi:hypothetical protein